jgi:hypothetical protein
MIGGSGIGDRRTFAHNWLDSWWCIEEPDYARTQPRESSTAPETEDGSEQLGHDEKGG